MSTSSSSVRTVFVIMPFVRVNAGARDEARLTSFFENHIKRPIETAEHLDEGDNHYYDTCRQ